MCRNTRPAPTPARRCAPRYRCGLRSGISSPTTSRPPTRPSVTLVLAHVGNEPTSLCCLAARPDSRHYPHELGVSTQPHGVSPTPEALILRYRIIGKRSPGMKAARLL